MVALQMANNATMRETHHMPSLYDLVAGILANTKKTVLETKLPSYRRFRKTNLPSYRRFRKTNLPSYRRFRGTVRFIFLTVPCRKGEGIFRRFRPI